MTKPIGATAAITAKLRELVTAIQDVAVCKARVRKQQKRIRKLGREIDELILTQAHAFNPSKQRRIAVNATKQPEA